MARPIKGERTAKADLTFCGWDPSLQGPGHHETKSDMIRRAAGWAYDSSHGRHPGDWPETPDYARKTSALELIRQREIHDAEWWVVGSGQRRVQPLKEYWRRLQRTWGR